MKRWHLFLIIPLMVFAFWGTTLIMRGSPSEKTATPAQQSAEQLTVYTTGQATSPQMHFWLAHANGDLHFTPEVKFWKNLMDLEGLLLAGKGDIWVGHVDGFVQAARRGAPVQLVSVTGWKKFYILSRRQEIKNFQDVMALKAGTEIAIAPPHSPAVPILKTMESYGMPKFQYLHHEPKQLLLQTMQGKQDLMVLPEPVVSILLSKVKDLHIVASVEESFGQLTGTPPRLPLAGIAINTKLLAAHPDLPDKLHKALLKQQHILERDLDAGVAALPENFQRFVAKGLVKASMKRDVIHIESASQAKAAILHYIRIMDQSNATAGMPIPESFWGSAKP